MTKAAQLFTAIQSEASGTVRKLAGTITDGTNAVQARTKQDRLAAEGVKQSGDKFKDLGIAASAISMKTGEYADTIDAAAKNYADNNNLHLNTVDAQRA